MIVYYQQKETKGLQRFLKIYGRFLNVICYLLATRYAEKAKEVKDDLQIRFVTDFSPDIPELRIEHCHVYIL